MIISIPDHDYYVKQKLFENEILEVLLCSEMKGETGSVKDNAALQQKYRIVRIKDKQLIYELLPFFVDLKNNTAFTAYCGCFSKDGYLNLIFLHSDYTGLFDKLDNERCLLRERMEIGKNLLEQILMLDMPDFILYDALAECNVTVSASLDVKFNYHLTSLKQYKKLGIDDVRDRLAVLYKKLFEYELQRMASADIEQFIEDLSKTRYANYFEIYRRYEEVYDKLLTGELTAIRPNTFLFRLWDRIKSLGKYIKPAVTFILFVMMVCYLLYSILHKEVDAAKVFNYQQIGTVEIKESSNDAENAK